jgi:beta-propeller repeat-containing protein
VRVEVTQLKVDYTVPHNAEAKVSGLNDTGDAFVLKLNHSGSALIYSTYLGGNGDENGYTVAVDGSGNAYVSGFTTSSN